MARKDLSERLEPKSVLEWRKWLEKNHDTSSGVRLVIRKKNSAGDGVGYEEAVEEALAFGWIVTQNPTRSSTFGGFEPSKR